MRLVGPEFKEEKTTIKVTRDLERTLSRTTMLCTPTDVTTHKVNWEPTEILFRFIPRMKFSGSWVKFGWWLNGRTLTVGWAGIVLVA